MFLLATTALAGVLIGWPCQRLNWGWRNVWSTCSIHSFAPATAGEAAATIPTGFRTYGGTPAHPANSIHAGGYYIPGGAGIPQTLCAAASNTGAGSTSTLRNRCRRAVDAYGALVRLCTAVPATISGPGVVAPAQRGPNILMPLGITFGYDVVPTTLTQPHLSNSQNLALAAQFCATNVPFGPFNQATPSNTCPGLLGWFTVVYNTCGFTNAPALSPNSPMAAGSPAGTPAGLPNIYSFFPVGNPQGVAPAIAPVAPSATKNGWLCSTAAVGPDSWNVAGPTFRTSRCRKALDQFGRTANRCNAASLTTPAGPMQSGGFSDPLRLLAVGWGSGGAPAGAPNGLNYIAPNCN